MVTEDSPSSGRGVVPRSSSSQTTGPTATLECGNVLEFEAAELLPRRGDVVPCRLHGYCVTQLVLASTSSSSHWPGRRRRGPRREHELLEWLRHHPVTTLSALRRQRFTLRLVAAAANRGYVVVDMEAGDVRLVVCPLVDCADRPADAG